MCQVVLMAELVSAWLSILRCPLAILRDNRPWFVSKVGLARDAGGHPEISGLDMSCMHLLFSGQLQVYCCKHGGR